MLRTVLAACIIISGIPSEPVLAVELLARGRSKGGSGRLLSITYCLVASEGRPSQVGPILLLAQCTDAP